MSSCGGAFPFTVTSKKKKGDQAPADGESSFVQAGPHGAPEEFGKILFAPNGPMVHNEEKIGS
jgi:hypothetical protein